MNIKKILCPLEMDEFSKNLFSTVSFMAKSFDARLYLLHVVEKVDISMAKILGYEDNVKDFVEEEGKKKEAFMMEKVKELEKDGLKVEARIRYGKPYKEILEAAEELNCDLIVMGTQKEEGLETYFIGSNTWGVIERKKFPVLTVREPFNKPPENILVPLDLSELSFEAIDYAKGFSKKFNSNLFFLHILVILESMAKWEAVNRIEHEVKKKIGKEVEDGSSIIVSKSPDAANGILKTAEDISADLIIMTTHGRGGVEKALFGSVTEKIIRNSDIPVISLPPISAKPEEK
jgi:nucleotide-binding universal stress UspA family protein